MLGFTLVDLTNILILKGLFLYRSIFFNNVNGIILVHDLTNNKSLQNLSKWLNEVLNHESTLGLNSIKVASSTNLSSINKFFRVVCFMLFKRYFHLFKKNCAKIYKINITINCEVVSLRDPDCKLIGKITQ